MVTPTTAASATESATSSSLLALASGLEAVVKVSEAYIAQIQQQQQVEIVAEAYPNQTFIGRVQQISPEAIVENNVTSFEVRVSLVTGQTQLRSGMNIDATFLGETVPKALMVPTVAIATQDGKLGVMIANSSGQPKFQPVTVGLTQGGQTQIKEGLVQSDRVFIDLPQSTKPRGLFP